MQVVPSSAASAKTRRPIPLARSSIQLLKHASLARERALTGVDVQQLWTRHLQRLRRSQKAVQGIGPIELWFLLEEIGVLFYTALQSFPTTQGTTTAMSTSGSQLTNNSGDAVATAWSPGVIEGDPAGGGPASTGDPASEADVHCQEARKNWPDVREYIESYMTSEARINVVKALMLHIQRTCTSTEVT